jgi:hypothetical protein
VQIFREKTVQETKSYSESQSSITVYMKQVANWSQWNDDGTENLGILDIGYYIPTDDEPVNAGSSGKYYYNNYNLPDDRSKIALAYQ